VLLLLVLSSTVVLAGCGGDDSQVNAGGTVGEDARAWYEDAKPF
jgi:hypothetical protein